MTKNAQEFVNSIANDIITGEDTYTIAELKDMINFKCYFSFKEDSKSDIYIAIMKILHDNDIYLD